MAKLSVRHAAIAQQVERILGKDEVASSNLASSSIKKPGNSRVSGLSSFLPSVAAITETDTQTDTIKKGELFMNLLEKSKALVCNNEFHDLSANLLGDCVALLSGDLTAAARIVCSVTKGALAFREQLFWCKFEWFLNHIDTSEEFLGEFCRVLAENEDNTNTLNRLIDTIDKVDTMDKAKYLANASRCLAAGFIERTTYFRICHALKNSLQEDLLFLQNTILENGVYEYSDTIQGLWNCGLMYQSVIDSDGNDRYAFTPFAHTLDMYALSYGDLNRYPNPLCEKTQASFPQKININTVSRLG